MRREGWGGGGRPTRVGWARGPSLLRNSGHRLFQPELAGGALLDVGIYPAMWISMVLGTPSKVTAHARMAESGVDCHTFATFEYESGAMAHLECSFNACLANEITIVGETGIIKARLDAVHVTVAWRLRVHGAHAAVAHSSACLLTPALARPCAQVARPPQAPESYVLTTRQGDAFDPLLLRASSVTHTVPLDPPHIAVAPGYNFVGSQGFHFEAEAVQVARKKPPPRSRADPSRPALIQLPCDRTAQDAIGKGLKEHPEMPLSETLAVAKVFDQIRAQIGLVYPWDAELK